MNDVVVYIIGFSLTIIGMLGGALYWLGKRFATIDKRFEDIDKRFGDIDRRFEDMERKLVLFADSVRSSVVAINSLLVEYLGLKGVLTQQEAAFLSREASRLLSMVKVNPITAEELEFLKSVFSKPVEEMTVEELERAAEIAKQWWYREGKEEAYKLFLIAWTIRAYKLFQEGGEGQKR